MRQCRSAQLVVSVRRQLSFQDGENQAMRFLAMAGFTWNSYNLAGLAGRQARGQAPSTAGGSVGGPLSLQGYDAATR